LLFDDPSVTGDALHSKNIPRRRPTTATWRSPGGEITLAACKSGRSRQAGDRRFSFCISAVSCDRPARRCRLRSWSRVGRPQGGEGPVTPRRGNKPLLLQQLRRPVSIRTTTIAFDFPAPPNFRYLGPELKPMKHPWPGPTPSVEIFPFRFASEIGIGISRPRRISLASGVKPRRIAQGHERYRPWTPFGSLRSRTRSRYARRKSGRVSE